MTANPAETPASVPSEPEGPGAKLGGIGRHGAIYGLGVLLNRAAGFLLIPVLLHTLSTEEWGTYSLILAISQFLLVVPAAIVDTMVRLYFDHAEDPGQRKVVATTLAAFLIVSAAILALSYPTALLTSHLVFHDSGAVPALFIANVGLVFELLFEIQLAYLRIQRRSALYGIASLGRSLLQFAAAILLVIVFGMGVTGVVLGGALAVAGISIPIGIGMARRTGIHLDRGTLRDMWALAKPIAPAWSAKAGLDLLEPYLVTLFAGLSSFGILAVANKVVDQLRVLLTGPFSRIWEVTLFEARHREEQFATMHRALAYFLLLLATAGLGLALFANPIVRLIAAKPFWSAAAVVPILVLNPVAKLVNYHFEIALIERKRPGYLPAINIAALVLAAGLYYGLVPRFGIMGAAVAGLLTQLARMIATLAFVVRCSTYARRFPWPACAVLLLAGAVCLLVSGLFFPGAGLPDLGGRLLLLIAFASFGVLGPTLRGDERRALLAALHRWWVERTMGLRYGTSK